jgi:hypothetical protein
MRAARSRAEIRLVRRLWIPYAVAGATAGAAYVVLPPKPLREAALVAVGAVAVLAAARGVGANRPPLRRPWWLLLLGVALLVAGDAVAVVLEHAGRNVFPSAAASTG